MTPNEIDDLAHSFPTEQAQLLAILLQDMHARLNQLEAELANLKQRDLFRTPGR